MIGKQNYSPSTLPVPTLAPAAFGVIVIHTHNNACVLSLLYSPLLKFLWFLGCCICCLSRNTWYPYTHSDMNFHCVVLTKIIHVLHLICKLLPSKWTIIAQGSVTIQWMGNKTTSISILQWCILSTSGLWENTSTNTKFQQYWFCKQFNHIYP